MGKFERFEDIHAWQRARELTRLVYQITRQKRLSKDWDLQRALRRTAVSIMANIAEGLGRRSHREFRISSTFPTVRQRNSSRTSTWRLIKTISIERISISAILCATSAQKCSKGFKTTSENSPTLNALTTQLANSQTLKLLNP